MINHAYTVLRDPQLRREYDQQRGLHRSSQWERDDGDGMGGRKRRRYKKGMFRLLGRKLGNACGWVGERFRRVTLAVLGLGAALARRWRRKTHAAAAAGGAVTTLGPVALMMGGAAAAAM